VPNLALIALGDSHHSQGGMKFATQISPLLNCSNNHNEHNSHYNQNNLANNHNNNNYSTKILLQQSLKLSVASLDTLADIAKFYKNLDFQKMDIR
jgi:hypothetical protein